MVGKHIFVRCRNEQGNAGTWTAAMTEQLVDKDVVRNQIEPRCNVDETFAQDTLMACPTNNILRLYYATPSTLVVSRSYWVTDRITEVQGRKGAYSTSYILTGDDVARFISDYNGAFDSGCFERYDDLVARIASADNRITVNPSLDIFSHGTVALDTSVLTRCGFTQDSFLAFMSGLYDAMENKKQLAVILPQSLRSAWVERGDDAAERLGHLILALLPDFTRINCGMVSHWSCQIKDRMVSDMQLLFVHPRSDEDIAFLKREGAHIVDLDSGRFTTEIKSHAPNYFSFLWNNLSHMERIEEFWAYAKTNYRKLLRGRPTSAASIECIYLIRTVKNDGYQDQAMAYRTLRLAAHEFAGAGTRVPMAEAFLSEAMDKLALGQKPTDDTTEAFLRHLMAADGEKTSHQTQEYQLLLSSVEAGTAKPETVTALCGELDKAGRDADAYFLSYLTDKVGLPAEKITPQLTQLVSGIFQKLIPNQTSTTATGILQTVFSIIQGWTERLLSSGLSWQALVPPFAEACSAYINNESKNAKLLRMAYDLLFLLRTKANQDLRDKCAKVLLTEEVRIYRAGSSAILNDGSSRFSVFANAFLAQFPHMTAGSPDTLSAGYDQLFRVLFNPERSTSDAALSIYETVTEQLLTEHPNANKLPALIFTAQERSLRDKPPVWQASNTERLLLALEQIHLQLLPDYVPGNERLSVLVAHLSADNRAIYPLFADYIARAPFTVRQNQYNILSTANMLPRLFAHMLFFCDWQATLDEITALLALPRDKRLHTLFALNLYDGSSEASARFTSWYTRELEQLLFSETTGDAQFSPQRHSLVMNEWQLLRSLESLDRSLSTAAYEVFAQIVCRLYNTIGRDEIDSMPGEIVRDIVRLQAKVITAEPLTHKSIFEFVWLCDTTILEKTSIDLCSLCEQAASASERTLILQNRLRMHLDAQRCPDPLTARLYLARLSAPSSDAFPLQEFLTSLHYFDMSPLDRGILLLRIVLQLHHDHSPMERNVAKSIINSFASLPEEDLRALHDQKFLSLWQQIKTFDYARYAQLPRLVYAGQRSQRIQFDVSMLLLCLIGLFVLLIPMTGLFLLCRFASSTILILIVLVLVLLARPALRYG